MSEGSFSIELRQLDGYRFATRFDSPAVPELLSDEPPPLGQDSGPNPTRLLLLSVANCLSASLLFACRKFKSEPGPLRTSATATTVRNEQKRLRIGGMQVDIHLGVAAAALPQLDRVLAQFEDYCVVTQSVRTAIPVAVRVFDSSGTALHG